MAIFSKGFSAGIMLVGLTVGAVTVTLTTSSFAAASAISSAFQSNVAANADFLDQSSRLALQHTSSSGIRVYARAEAQEAAKVASALGAKSSDTNMSSAETGLLTGRSVAVTGSAEAAANGRAPMGRGELSRLDTLSGRAFDDLYWQTQLDALSQLESDYRTYIALGDDPSLVALSQRELPKVLSRLAALTKV